MHKRTIIAYLFAALADYGDHCRAVTDMSTLIFTHVRHMDHSCVHD
jgi:hypothetical protein